MNSHRTMVACVLVNFGELGILKALAGHLVRDYIGYCASLPLLLQCGPHVDIRAPMNYRVKSTGLAAVTVM